MNVDLAGQLLGGNVLGVTADASVCEEIAKATGRGGSPCGYRKMKCGQAIPIPLPGRAFRADGEP